MTDQAQIADDRRGFRWWAARISVGALALVLVLGVGTWLAGISAKSKLKQ
jgi:hypothetical protein